jgi:hypothetical protein
MIRKGALPFSVALSKREEESLDKLYKQRIWHAVKV